MYSNKIKFYREQQGITKIALARLTGLSAGYICHLEKGDRKNPSIRTMEKIAKKLHKTVAEIFFEGDIDNGKKKH